MNLKSILAAVVIAFSTGALAENPAATPGGPARGALKAGRDAHKSDQAAIKGEARMRQDVNAAKAAKAAGRAVQSPNR